MFTCVSTADDLSGCGSQTTVTFTASSNVRYVAVLDAFLGSSPSGTPYAVQIVQTGAGCPCAPLGNPMDGSFACTIDPASGGVLPGDTCTLTWAARYTPSVPTVTCLDGVLGSATCVGTFCLSQCCSCSLHPPTLSYKPQPVTKKPACTGHLSTACWLRCAQ